MFFMSLQSPIAIACYLEDKSNTANFKEFLLEIDYQQKIGKQFNKSAKKKGLTVINAKVCWAELLDADLSKSEVQTTILTATTLSAAKISSIGDWVIPSPSQEYTCNGIDVAAVFFTYKQNAFEVIKSDNHAFAVEKILQISSLYSILFFKRHPQASNSFQKAFEATMITELRNQESSPYTGIKESFPSEIRDEIEQILDALSKEQDLWEASKNLNKLANTAESFDIFNIIKFLNNLIDEVTGDDVAVSENRLTCSFIHAAMKSIFKHDVYTVPHMSNHAIEEITWRPDYKVSKLNSGGKACQMCIGEVKPSSCCDKSLRDKDVVKIAKYSKDQLVKQKSNFFMTYIVQDDTLRFFLTTYASKSLFFFFKIKRFQIPTTVDNIVSVVVILTKLLRLRLLSKTFKKSCTFVEVSPSIPAKIIECLFWC
ncbi:hypothetical protein BD560DRAFT_463465 [Blakeslea trispora]|nr:hypothetical protein BD560DRAFT_463465 [Blakeslea trispora]